MTKYSEFSGNEIFPNKSLINSKGNISIDSVDLEGLANEYGTPLYVYDESTIISTIKDFQDSFGAELDNAVISYSTKAFSNPYLLKILKENGMSIDVVTGGELAVAKHIDFPPKRMNFHGNNKSPDELEDAINYGIGHITIDSFNEIENLKNIEDIVNLPDDEDLRILTYKTLLEK